MRLPGMQSVTKNGEGWILGFILILSYFTMVHNFSNPPALFWDENYHIASAQKYLNGVYFMEPHPPLGKMLIALGEKIVNANPVDNQFIGTDYATNPPPGFSFTGYRLFPVLLAWLTAPLLFCIFLLITRRQLWAMFFSMLYIFDNAIIVHLRSAMLESTLLFFGSLCVLAFLMLLEAKSDRKKFRNASLFFGLSFGCVLATKAFGLIFILLPFALMFFLWPDWKKFLRFAWISAITFIVVYCGIWYMHFSIGSTVNPALPDQGYYQASQEYKDILTQHKTRSLLSFPVMLRDHLDFVSHYQRGVPRLDLCKMDENGSPWFYWPFGGRTINYRWETPDGGAYRYLYLVPNPVVWAVGLIGIVLSAFLLLSSVLLPLKEPLERRYLLATFLGIYVSYMIAVSQITRVMYLYHYFIPLLLSFILAAISFMEIKRIGKFTLNDDRRTGLLLTMAVLIFLGFQFMHPFSYYELIGDTNVKRRNILDIWEVRCVKCDQQSPVVIPTK